MVATATALPMAAIRRAATKAKMSVETPAAAWTWVMVDEMPPKPRKRRLPARGRGEAASRGRGEAAAVPRKPPPKPPKPLVVELVEFEETSAEVIGLASRIPKHEADDGAEDREGASTRR